MKELNFYIVGPPASNDEPTYWNVDRGWVIDPIKATPFTGEVLCRPSPEGTQIIIVIEGLLSQATEAVASYEPLSGWKG